MIEGLQKAQEIILEEIKNTPKENIHARMAILKILDKITREIVNKNKEEK